MLDALVFVRTNEQGKLMASNGATSVQTGKWIVYHAKVHRIFAG
jgi:hypothetical protein